jgi:DNA-binding GntR family transcriptional regulator
MQFVLAVAVHPVLLQIGALELAVLLGVGLLPIQSALLALEAQGQVEVQLVMEMSLLVVEHSMRMEF